MINETTFDTEMLCEASVYQPMVLPIHLPSSLRDFSREWICSLPLIQSWPWRPKRHWWHGGDQELRSWEAVIGETDMFSGKGNSSGLDDPNRAGDICWKYHICVPHAVNTQNDNCTPWNKHPMICLPQQAQLQSEYSQDTNWDCRRASTGGIAEPQERSTSGCKPDLWDSEAHRSVRLAQRRLTWHDSCIYAQILLLWRKPV